MNHPPLTITRLSGFGRGKNQTLTGDTVKLGSASDCDVRFDATWDKTVANYHATLRWNEETVWLEDLSKSGCWIDGQRVPRRQIASGTEIELGKGGPRVRVEYQASARQVPQAASPAPAPQRRSAPPPTPAQTAPVARADVPVSGYAASAPAKRSMWKWMAMIVAPMFGVIVLPYRRSMWKWVVVASTAIIAALAAIWGIAHYVSSRPAKISDWEFRVDMDEEIFPSLIVASSTMKSSPFDILNDSKFRLGDRRGTIGFVVKSPAAGTKVRIQIEGNEIMHRTAYDVELPEANHTYFVYPPISYAFDALRGVKQTTPLTINASISMNGQSAGQKSKTVRVASINDCPFAVAMHGDKEREEPSDFAWMFAAYVNENHPISDGIRQEALKTGIVNEFAGYQLGPDGVLRQAFAIWHTLQRRGMRYSNITTTPDGGKRAVYSQYVRFIDQTINNAQANCVDGSVLFASILRQIGIEPVLVLVPGHMFVGFFLDEQKESLVFLETTMMGIVANREPSANPQDVSANRNGRTKFLQIAAIQGVLDPIAEQNVAKKESEASFISAVKKGTEEYSKHFPGGSENVTKISSHQSASKIHRGDARCRLLPVMEARDMGLLPIGYQR